MKLTSDWTATTLRSIRHRRRRSGATLVFLLAPEAAAPQGNIVGACDSLIAPGHSFCLKSKDGRLVDTRDLEMKES